MFKDNFRSNGTSGQNKKYHILFVWHSPAITQKKKLWQIYEFTVSGSSGTTGSAIQKLFFLILSQECLKQHTKFYYDILHGE
jgi:hypothetical protein